MTWRDWPRSIVICVSCFVFCFLCCALDEEAAEVMGRRRPEGADARVKKLKCDFFLAGKGEDGGGEDAGVSDDAAISSASEVAGTEEDRGDEVGAESSFSSVRRRRLGVWEVFGVVAVGLREYVVRGGRLGNALAEGYKCGFRNRAYS